MKNRANRTRLRKILTRKTNVVRRVVPELLDGLHPDDPEALRSRRDLRVINRLMGNFRWARRAMARFPAAVVSGVVEVGAGEGIFCKKLKDSFPAAPITGIDLVPKPAGLRDVRWLEGDIFHHLPQVQGGVLTGVMILHHFPEEQLRQFGELLRNFPVICFCEPWRAALPHVWGGLLWPWIGGVTRHDMPVSINAGFRAGELAALLNLEDRRVVEVVDWRGSLRLLAWREGCG